MQTVDIAVVGCGSWAVHAHLPAIAADPRANLAAVVDTDPAARTTAQATFGAKQAFASVEEMLPNVELDAAVVALPHALHAAAAMPLLEHGAHLLIEKPMVLTPADGRELLAAAAARDLEVVVGYTWHYNRQVAELQSQIRDGRIGKVEFVSCLFGSTVREYYSGSPESYDLGYTRQPRRNTYSDPRLSGGGQGQTQLTHAAALLVHMADVRPTTVTAMTESYELPVDLADALAVRFDNGAIGTLGSTGGVLFGHPEVLEYRIFGSGGHVAFDVMQGRAAIHGPDGAVDEVALLDLPDRYPMHEPVRNLIAIAAEGAVNQSPGDVGQTVVELLDAMYRSSAAGGQPVGVG